MATMPDEEQEGVWAETMRAALCPGSLTKPQWRTTINAVDSWCSANASSYNNALPAAARTALTAAQKAELLAFVATRRHRAGV